jgi:uncharacterized protein with NAD-binding domain and iron-sulfur cluster
MSRTVAVIGAGIAGLTAAFDLSSRGYDVTIVDEASGLGGRLNSAPAIPLFGCYTATWALLDKLNAASLPRTSKHTPLEFLQSNGARTQFAPLPLPSPLNTLIGTTLFQGLSMRDRWHLLTFLERTWERDPPMPEDLETKTAEQWLGSIGQSETGRRNFWNPLSRLLLADDLATVSASLFMRTLQRHFFTGARASKIIIPSVDVASLLVTTLAEQLSVQRVSVRLHTTVTGFRFAHDRMTAAEVEGQGALTADYFVAALPFSRLRRLLPERVITHYAYFQQLGRLQGSSMLAVHLQAACWSRHASLILLPSGRFHWIILRPSRTGEIDTTDVYLVAAGETSLFSSRDITVLETAQADLAAACPSLDAPTWISHRIHRISETILSVKPGTQHCRPLQQSPFTNLFLAGDWTDTGWPANVESAIVSGDRCAAAVQ